MDRFEKIKSIKNVKLEASILKMCYDFSFHSCNKLNVSEFSTKIQRSFNSAQIKLFLSFSFSELVMEDIPG